MSLYINNLEVTGLYVNGVLANEGYFNNVKFWGVETPWTDYSWNDLYTLCNEVSLGTKSFPSTIALGNTKVFTINGTNTTATLVGINLEGTGTLTFQYSHASIASLFYYTTGSSVSTFNGWPTSNLRDMCIDDYNNCNIKNYIKTVTKSSVLFDLTTLTTLETFFVAGYDEANSYDLTKFLLPYGTDYTEGYWARDSFILIQSEVFGDRYFCKYFLTTQSSPTKLNYGGSNDTNEFSSTGSNYEKEVKPFFVIG